MKGPILRPRSPIEALDIETTATVDWVELGQIFAEQYSSAQADFLLGFYEKVEDMQLAFIGDEDAFDPHRAELAGVLRQLADHIEEGGY